MLLDTLDRLCDRATSQQEDIVTTAAVLEASICSKYTSGGVVMFLGCRNRQNISQWFNGIYSLRAGQ